MNAAIHGRFSEVPSERKYGPYSITKVTKRKELFCKAKALALPYTPPIKCTKGRSF